jgi:hypothetical protein
MFMLIFVFFTVWVASAFAQTDVTNGMNSPSTLQVAQQATGRIVAPGSANTLANFRAVEAMATLPILGFPTQAEGRIVNPGPANILLSIRTSSGLTSRPVVCTRCGRVGDFFHFFTP